MRKNTLGAIILVFAVVVGVVYTASSGIFGNTLSQNKTSQYGSTLYNVTPNIKVEIPPSFELYGIVYYLAMGRNDSFVTGRDDYLNEVDRWFSSYKNHTAVLLLKKRLEDGDEYAKGYTNSLVEYILENYTYPEDINLSKVSKDLNNADWLTPANKEFLREFLPALKDLAEKSNFTEFYREHLQYYWGDLSIYVNALKKLPPDEFLKKYAGVSGVKYLFVHPYLVIVHGYNMIEEINGTKTLEAIGNIPLVRRDPQRTKWSYITARDDFLGLPLNRDYIKNPGLNELIYLSFIYHELGHDITVPKLDTLPLKLDRMGYFIYTIKADMPYLAMYDGHFHSVDMIYEGFADAWSDFALSHVDPDCTGLLINMQKAWGEFWIGYQYNLTKKYVEVSMKEGKPFSEYVPQILDGLRAFASEDNVSKVYEENVPVTPLRAFDRASVTKKIVVIYGTGGKSESMKAAVKSAAREIAKNLEEFYGRWSTGTSITVKADVNVTPEDLKENIVLVGDPSVNSVVEEMQEEFPLRFVRLENGSWVIKRNSEWNISSFVLTTNEEDPVVTGELRDTSKAALLLAVMNPNNPRNYVVWVAGTDEKTTDIFQNPTYYLSSYEIWSEKGIEMGFYVQPLASSGG